MSSFNETTERNSEGIKTAGGSSLKANEKEAAW
jgi:hypothetical protein